MEWKEAPEFSPKLLSPEEGDCGATKPQLASSLPPRPNPRGLMCKKRGGGRKRRFALYLSFLPPSPYTHPPILPRCLSCLLPFRPLHLSCLERDGARRCVPPPPAREGKRQSGRRPTANTVHCLLEGNALLEGSTTLFLLHFSFPPSLHRILTAKRGSGQE